MVVSRDVQHPLLTAIEKDSPQRTQRTRSPAAIRPDCFGTVLFSAADQTPRTPSPQKTSGAALRRPSRLFLRTLRSLCFRLRFRVGFFVLRVFVANVGLG